MSAHPRSKTKVLWSLVHRFGSFLVIVIDRPNTKSVLLLTWCLLVTSQVSLVLVSEAKSLMMLAVCNFCDALPIGSILALQSIGVPVAIPHSIITTCVIFRFQSYGISQSHTMMQSIHSWWFEQCLPHCTTRSFCFGQPFCRLGLYMYMDTIIIVIDVSLMPN